MIKFQKDFMIYFLKQLKKILSDEEMSNLSDKKKNYYKKKVNELKISLDKMEYRFILVSEDL
jgi:hypothetical protein